MTKVQVMERTSWWAIALLALAVVLTISLIFSILPASANEGYFDLEVRHGINGTSIGLDKDLPVDVYVNGDYAFTFSFKDRISTSLPAGTYTIMVKLADTETTVMSLGPAEFPGGVDVDIKAKLSANKTPVLKVKVK
jgi:hypothetical protein